MKHYITYKIQTAVKSVTEIYGFSLLSCTFLDCHSFSKDPNPNQVLSSTPVNPCIWEVDSGGCKFKASPLYCRFGTSLGSMRPYILQQLKNKTDNNDPIPGNLT